MCMILIIITLSHIGKDVMKRKKKEHIFDYCEMMRAFNEKKHIFNPKSSEWVNMRFIPPFMINEELQDVISRSQFLKKRGGKCALGVNAVLFKKLYKKSTTAIISHLRFILQDETGSGCEAIVMVGGYSRSSILCKAVQKTFPHVKVMVPKNPDMAVLSGSLIMSFSQIGYERC